MKRAFTILLAWLALGCDSGVGPSPLFSSYFLSMVDGQPLPVPYSSEGTLLLAGSLGFSEGDRPRPSKPVSGTVSYGITIRRPDQAVEHSTMELNYTINDGVLRINLCPPLALCIVSTELVGPILGRTAELVLTHHLAGNPGSVYRYFPSLPD